MRVRKNLISEVNDVDLVPMMDVLMSILTFFIIISMTLTGQQVANVKLPTAELGKQDAALDAMIVGLTPEGQILVNNQALRMEQLADQMVRYFEKNPNGTILLKADRSLSYEKVVEILAVMREIGGDRVSLGIE